MKGFRYLIGHVQRVCGEQHAVRKPHCKEVLVVVVDWSLKFGGKHFHTAYQERSAQGKPNKPSKQEISALKSKGGQEQLADAHIL